MNAEIFLKGELMEFLTKLNLVEGVVRTEWAYSFEWDPNFIQWCLTDHEKKAASIKTSTKTDNIK